MDAFQGILRLEAKRGFDDQAVFGGLDEFLAQWRREMEAGGEEQPLKALAGIVGGAYREAGQSGGAKRRGYRQLTPGQREVWARHILEGLGEGAAAAAPASTGRRPAKAAAKKGTASRPPRPAAASPTAGPSLDAPTTRVPGVGPGIAAKLENLGVTTVRDLLYHFPRRHLTMTSVRDLSPDEEQAVVGMVWESGVIRLGAGRMQATEAIIGDETGNIRVLWFNQPFVARTLKANDRVMVTGRVSFFRGQRTLDATAYEVAAEGDEAFAPGRLAPVYPATEGLAQRTIRRVVRAALEGWGRVVAEILPEETRRRQGLMPLPEALPSYHYPADNGMRDAARRRLVFDELFVTQLALLSRKQRWQEQNTGTPIPANREVLDAFVGALPFSLTGAQQRCLEEVLRDMAGPRPMARLLQGEVGSGKTVVALAALLTAAAYGQQSAIMAPTEILAEQHFQTFSRLLQGFSKPVREPQILAVYVDPIRKPVVFGFLTGRLKPREKRGDSRAAGEPRAGRPGGDARPDSERGWVCTAGADGGGRAAPLRGGAAPAAGREGSPSARAEHDGDAHPPEPGADAVRGSRHLGHRRAAGGPAAGADAVGAAGPARHGLRLYSEAGGGGEAGLCGLPADPGVGGASNEGCAGRAPSTL